MEGDRNKKLVGLGAETLANALQELLYQYDAVDNKIQQLIGVLTATMRD